MGVNASVPEAQDLGLGAWTVDPCCTTLSGSFAAATLYLAAFYWRPGPGVNPFPQSVLIPNVLVGSWSAMQVGIFNQDQVGQNAPGTLLANSTNVIPTAGITVKPLTVVAATAPAVLPAGRYWVGMVVTGTTGTAASTPNILGAALGCNAGTDTAHMRFATAATVTTVATFTPSGNTAAGATLCLCACVL
jgi:hypothetical protein